MIPTRSLPNIDGARELLWQLASRPSAVGPQPLDKPLVLYGAGRLGRMAGSLFRKLRVSVAYAVDREAVPGSRLLDTIPVIRPEAASRTDRETCLIAVCVVTTAYEPIHAELAAMGWRHILPVYDVLDAYRDHLSMDNGWFAGRLVDEDIDKIGAVLAGWSDDWSRAAHLQFLAWRLHRWEWEFHDAPVNIDDRYFIEPIRRAMGAQERFLDAGAHHGHVIARWLDIVRHRFEAILAVEADHENVTRLKRRIALLPRETQDRILVRDCALAAEKGSCPYSHGWDLSSRIMPGADGFVRSLRIDDLDFPFTFGKVHLEGGELEALRGGTAVLHHCRPVLAVTTYHNRDGLWRIPKFLMETLPDYRYFMRLHAWCGTGSVVYAVPNERMRDA